MTTLPHVHNETGECLACDLERVRLYLDISHAGNALDRISTALATSQARIAELEQVEEHCVGWVEEGSRQMIAMTARVNELEADREHLEEGARLLAGPQIGTVAQAAAFTARREAWLKAERERRVKR